MLKRFGILTCIAVLVGLLAAAALSGSFLTGWASTVRIIVGVVAAAALLRIIFKAKVDPPPTELGKPPVVVPTKHEIAQAYYNAVNTYQARSLGLLVKMLIDLPSYLERINEDVVLEEEIPQLEVSTRQIYRIGALKEESFDKRNLRPSLLVPLLFVRKGTLLDGFSVYDAEGREIPTLSYNQTRGLLAYAIRTIIKSAPEAGLDMGITEREAKMKDITAKLTDAVCSPGPLKKQEQAIRERVTELLASADELPVKGNWNKKIRAFCERLADYYVIIAEMPPPDGGHIQVTYRQRISVESSSLRLANRMRSRFGLRFAVIDIPLHLFALRAEAYHLQMNAAPMQYVYDHHLEWLTSERRVKQSDLNDGEFKPYVRMHHDSAEPAAHLYIRRQSDSQTATNALRAAAAKPEADAWGWPDRLKSVIGFREIPPGALGAAAAISLLTAVLICFFALTQIGEMGPATSTATVTVASDIPALLIALPGIASLIIGAWLDLSHLRRASLTAYWGLGASMILSFASSLYFLLDAYKALPGHITMIVAYNVRVETDIEWLVLAGLAVVCSLFLIRDVIYSSRYYFQCVKGRIARRTQ